MRVQIPPDAYIYEKEADGFLFLLIYRKLLIGSINFSIPAGGKQYEKKNVDLDAFLYHMEHCPDCKEEYDVYYTMLMGMRFLESDNMSALKMDSEQKLLSAEDYLYKYKIKFIAKILCFVLLCVGMILQL